MVYQSFLVLPPCDISRVENCPKNYLKQAWFSSRIALYH
jgi:hypothetical protein